MYHCLDVAACGACWLRDRQAGMGIALDEAVLRVDGYRSWRQRGGKGIALSTLDFEGVLTVADSARLVEALLRGIGPAKAFGCSCADCVKVKLYGRCKTGMTDMEWKDRIETDPEICGGRPRVKGTRLTVEFLLGLKAAGWTEAQIIENYPHLKEDDLRAVFAFAHHLIEEEKYLVLPDAA